MSELPILERQVSRCRACGAAIIWLTTNNNRRMPVNAESAEYTDEFYEQGKHVSHFTTCSGANAWRRR